MFPGFYDRYDIRMAEQLSSRQTPAAKVFSLYDWVFLGWCLSIFLLFLIVVGVGGNWLHDFLLSPIGIKENPPEPGIAIQIEKIAVIPVSIVFTILCVLKLWMEDRGQTSQS